MGRGDKRTAKGKRFKGSFGNSRPHRVKVKAATPKVEAAKKAKTPQTEKPVAKKSTAKKTTKKKAE